MSRIARITSLSLLALAASACAATVRTPTVHESTTPPSADQQKEPLKVHTYSGSLYLLTSWMELPGDSALAATGDLYDAQRKFKASGGFRIPRDSIALIETNVRSAAHPVGLFGMAVWITLLGTTTTICVLNPKTCFGSCPTFYTQGPAQDRPDAEGFSGSVARSLEASDIDAIPGARVKDGTLEIHMRNEALETHAVRSLRIAAVPRSNTPGEHVFQTAAGEFLAVSSPAAPDSCSAEDGDCRRALATFDSVERVRPADPHDLGRKEVLDLEFAPRSGALALMLGARHSFMSTYLFYQAIGFAGRDAGTHLLNLEKHGAQSLAGGFEMFREIGGVEVFIQESDGSWTLKGEFGEHGPLATDVQAVQLGKSAGDGPVRVRLRAAQGAWRFGYAALAVVTDVVEPVHLPAISVHRADTADPIALERLLDPDRYLVTYPGDVFTISFAVPDQLSDAFFFLESRGYYYEWMRQEWLSEESPLMLGAVTLAPRAALRMLAPRFKDLEPVLEKQFWSSRFGRK